MMVYGYILCDQILEGELAHSCIHGPPPHEIKVVVVGVDNPKRLMDELKKELNRGDAALPIELSKGGGPGAEAGGRL
jgi:hypothetical protein